MRWIYENIKEKYGGNKMNRNNKREELKIVVKSAIIIDTIEGSR